MITRITPIEEFQRLFTETFLGKTDKVTKISDNSVLSGVSYGVAKVAQKCVKDIALVETNIFPDSSSGSTLSNIAEDRGMPDRFGTSQSTTYLRISADPGTNYLKNIHNFISTSGITFTLESDITIPAIGYLFAKVRSVDSGSKTNADPNTITKVNPIPIGHKYVTNDFTADGGRDIEDDSLMKKRLKEGYNIGAQKTLSFLEQSFLIINPNILRVIFQGFTENGKTILAIATQNGTTLSNLELTDLLNGIGDSLSLTDQKDFNNTLYGVELVNIEYQYIDIDLYCLLEQNADPDEVRKNIQAAFMKKVDYRLWNEGDTVKWDELLTLAKNTKGMKYIPNQGFSPNIDISIDKTKLPRFRSFIMRDLEGNIITNTTGTINPTYFPKSINKSFVDTVLG